MAEQANEDDRCRIITETALEKAVEKCDSEEAVKRQVADLMGFASDEPDPDCEASLSEGLNEETLQDFRGVRQWVMCRAWQLIDSGEESFRGAVQRAWNEAEQAADEEGIDI